MPQENFLLRMKRFETFFAPIPNHPPPPQKLNGPPLNAFVVTLKAKSVLENY